MNTLRISKRLCTNKRNVNDNFHRPFREACPFLCLGDETMIQSTVRSIHLQWNAAVLPAMIHHEPHKIGKRSIINEAFLGHGRVSCEVSFMFWLQRGIIIRNNDP